MKESDLALKIIEYMESLGYTSYKEVSMRGKGSNSRADCYFIKEGETVAVETKLSMTLKLIEQSYKWKNHANKVYVCIPSVSRKGWKARRFAIKVCESMGIGVFELTNNGIKESKKAKYNQNTKLPPLYEEQKSSIAGNSNGEFFTAFKNTVNLIKEFMSDKDEYLLSDIVKEVKHHYKSNSSAKNSLKKNIERGIIEGFQITKKEKKIYIIKNNI